jgi:MFS superfamily sulfate permease-like transporter
MFVGVIGLLAAIAIPILQASGVDVNWWTSLIAYVVIVLACVWSYLKHAVPDKGKFARVGGSAVLIVAIASLAAYAVAKQYRRDHRPASVESPANSTPYPVLQASYSLDMTAAQTSALQFGVYFRGTEGPKGIQYVFQ